MVGTSTNAVVHDYLGWCRDERGSEWASMASLSLTTEDGTSVVMHKDVLGAVCKVGRVPPANLDWSLRPLLANRGVALRLKHQHLLLFNTGQPGSGRESHGWAGL